MNDYHLKVVKIQGEFVWHSHEETDEVFIVLDGEMRITVVKAPPASAVRRRGYPHPSRFAR